MTNSWSFDEALACIRTNVVFAIFVATLPLVLTVVYAYVCRVIAYRRGIRGAHDKVMKLAQEYASSSTPNKKRTYNDALESLNHRITIYVYVIAPHTREVFISIISTLPRFFCR
jgi:hypothetical protein